MITTEYFKKYTNGAMGRYWPFIRPSRASYRRVPSDLCPSITVVTPSYNQAEFLEETICSVIAQDYPNLEYIVMDGGSVDQSVRIIERYSPWIKFWVSEKDEGQADAIHKGFQKATGDIFCWLNSDDVFLPNTLWRVADFFVRNPGKDCVVGGVLWIDAKGQSLYDKWGAPLANLSVTNTFDRLLYWGQYACPQMSTFWRREAYWRVGGLDVNMQFSMDRDLFVRLAKDKSFGRIHYFLSCFRSHAASKSSVIQSVRTREDDFIQDKYAREAFKPLWRHMKTRYYSSDVFLRKWWLRFAYHAHLWRLPAELRG